VKTLEWLEAVALVSFFPFFLFSNHFLSFVSALHSNPHSFCVSFPSLSLFMFANSSRIYYKKKLRGFGPQANYADRATAAC
jgi:hypothetical protein